MQGSLEDRIARRREQLSRQTTELFDVPGFEGIFKAELRAVGWKKLNTTANAHQRVHDDSEQKARIAADQIIAATVAIHSVVDDEGNTRVAEGFTWRDAARAADKKIGPEIKMRPALIHLLGATRVVFLHAEWGEWLRSGNKQVDEELQRD